MRIRAGIAAALIVLSSITNASPQRAVSSGQRAVSKPVAQPRPHGTRVVVDPAKLVVDDGDTVMVRWAATDVETVRILGIDCPETRHVDHDLPYAQPFADEARTFALGVMSASTQI
jgi:endonuclease YncB( thermonuclease family)